MAETAKNVAIDQDTQENVDRWLKAQCVDEKTKAEIRYLQETDPQELLDAFYTHLHFGTGGLRGVMGIGSNRMNIYTVRAATQGLANYINQQNLSSAPSVAISYDSRHFSRTFAEEAAKVLAGNGIHAFIFNELRPTPLLSFAVRQKECIAGIMVTASHNAAKYNGYKVYWEDGAQVLPPHDVGIIQEVGKIRDLDQIQWVDTIEDSHISFLDKEIDKLYLETVRPLQNDPSFNQQYGKELSIVYTGLHGTGFTMVPKILSDWNFTNTYSLPEQNIPDGDFPTLQLPNPEYPEALKQGMAAMSERNADLLIATDPDADRMGVVVRHNGNMLPLTGNQIVSLCLDFICQSRERKNALPLEAAFVKTVVTTELFQVICDFYHRPCFNVLTGFKYIAALIRKWETEPHGNQFLFGGEESYGYLYGTHVRDKDAVICSALVAEMALYAKKEGKTLFDQLEELYIRHGLYVEELCNLDFPESKEGREAMQQVLPKLRGQALHRILNTAIIAIEDYIEQTKTDFTTGKTDTITLPKTNMIIYWLEDETKIVIRPSGTEPKVKLYCGVVCKTFQTLEEGQKKAQRRAHEIVQAFRNMITEE